MNSSARDFAAAHRDDNLEHLIQFLRIPSVSTDPAHKPDIERAVNWLVERMRQIGLPHTEVIPTAGHPVVYGEWLEAGPDAPTVLVYGHYDVQPTDPDDEWRTPPFEPTLRDGNVYARGASDDKGQLYTHLAALEAFARTAGRPPVNIKLFFEGEEEVGSVNLGTFINQEAERLTCDVAIISDTAMLNAETPAVIYGVRGLAYMEFEVQGPKSDLHSGVYGGAAHNPLQVIVEILAGMHDEHGRVAIPGFYDRVRPLSDEERAVIGRIPFDEAAYLEEVGAPALWTGEEGYTVLERVGARPTLEIHGIRGGFTGDGSKTVIPARASAKVSMRLVPDQDPHEIAALFEQYVRQTAPPTVSVTVRSMGLADAAVIPTDLPQMSAAGLAYQDGFGAEPVFMRSGGTIPVVTMLTKTLETPVVMMGFGLPDDNLHAPNEKMRLENFYRGIETVISFLERV